MKILLAILAFILAAPAQSQILDLILFKQPAASSTAATPTFSPGAGTYSSTQTVTISTATSLAVLCYTTDGTTPTESANLCSGGTTATYSTPITVSTTQTVKAIATLATYTDSAVGSAAYTISAGIGYVGAAHNKTTSAAAITLTYSPTAGNALVVGASISDTTHTVSSVAFTGGTCTTGGAAKKRQVGSTAADEIWACTGASSGITAIVVTLSGTPANGWVASVTELSGASGFGQTAGNNSASGASPSYTVPITIATANNWVVASCAVQGAETWTATNGTIRAQDSGGTGSSGMISDNTAASITSVVNSGNYGTNHSNACAALEVTY